MIRITRANEYIETNQHENLDRTTYETSVNMIKAYPRLVLENLLVITSILYQTLLIMDVIGILLCPWFPPICF